MGVVEEFKKFLIQGTLISLAVAFVVGLAIVTLIGALVNDIITPLIGAAVRVDFSQLGKLTINNSTVLGGAFLGSVINFLILMTVVFFLIVYPYQTYTERKAAREAAAPPTHKDCPFCYSKVDVKARRCAFCTSALTPS